MVIQSVAIYVWILIAELVKPFVSIVTNVCIILACCSVYTNDIQTKNRRHVYDRRMEYESFKS